MSTDYGHDHNGESSLPPDDGSLYHQQQLEQQEYEMNDKTYNGWTNYATWRVNLEIFDGIIVTEWFPPDEGRPDEGDVADYLKDYVEELIASETQANAREGVSRGYALAFLSDVNWHEIAQHLLDDIEWDEDEDSDD